MSQPPLPLSRGEARSIGPSVGLVEGPQCALVVVFGFVTYAWDAGDEVSRRLAAVQLVLARHASAVEVASGFGVSTATLFRWVRSLREDGAGGLVRERTGPRGPSKLSPAMRDRVVALRESGLTIRQVAEQSGVSTATVRVALGLVPARPSRTSTASGPAGPVAADPTEAADAADAAVAETVADDDDDAAVSLTVLAKPAPRSRERAAARAGELVEAPVVLTEGA